MFYKMPKGDGSLVLGLAVFAALAFLIPQLRTAQFAGVALFGWWMAALMLLGPLIALLRIFRR